MLRHRKKCAAWKDRPDPRGLAIWRVSRPGPIKRRRCKECGSLRIEHAPECPEDYEDRKRVASLERAGIPVPVFLRFLRALGKRYPHGVSIHGGPARGPEDALFPTPKESHE